MQSFFRFIDQNWKALSGTTLLAITVMSLIPLPELPLFPGSDKTHHLVAYGLLMFPVALHKPRNWVCFGLGFIAWGGAIELIQPYVNRYGEWLDLLANAIGIILGYFMAKLVLKLYKQL